MPHKKQRITTEIKALWQLAWPILIGQLANVGMSVADVAMAGHASAQDLAGIALGSSIWMIVFVTLMGVMMAVNPVISHHVGAKEWDRIPSVVRQALWKGVGVGLIAMLAVNGSAYFFVGMGLEPVVEDVATRFVRITSLGLPVFACYRVLYGYSTSLNQTKPIMLIAVLALALNVLLNWILVFGNLGFPAMGGVGCAWATLICMVFNLVALLWWMRRSAVYESTWPFDRFEAPHWVEIRHLLLLGLPIGVTYFAESSAFGLIALWVARFGTVQVAAHQIALNFSSLTFMLPLSLGLALLTRVGQALGAGDVVEARFRSHVGISLSAFLALIAALLIALLNREIVGLYTNDAVVIPVAAGLLLWAAWYQVSDAIQVSASCATRGYKETRLPMVIHLVAFWLIGLPLGCVLGLGWIPQWLPPLQAEGFWIGLVVGLGIAGSGQWLLLHYIAQKHLQKAVFLYR
ncbi:MAG: hypothetical protein RIR79_752 [Pseudomonadota bacterium]|jgi:MATE family multidrug resistance protein